MKGFQLDSNGDIVISGGHIQMVDGDELLRQTVQSVLGTNKGEWVLNTDEGIDFKNILGKHRQSNGNLDAGSTARYKDEISSLRKEVSSLKAEDALENEAIERLAKRLDGDV